MPRLSHSKVYSSVLLTIYRIVFSISNTAEWWPSNIFYFGLRRVSTQYCRQSLPCKIWFISKSVLYIKMIHIMCVMNWLTWELHPLPYRMRVAHSSQLNLITSYGSIVPSVASTHSSIFFTGRTFRPSSVARSVWLLMRHRFLPASSGDKLYCLMHYNQFCRGVSL